ncbi:ATP-dependent nuclease [Alcanivorax sediminis]|uniref:AAA family ATPase n=1 Tax=Alcanivorax sediminis TaxID=2663008 RepID=A0A6N7LRG2_9GAMM|nr:AAA family ATPase [Alcanivorax sediminis]MQX51684.1 AAA family ATPase [Alcanivorax sediminis]
MSKEEKMEDLIKTISTFKPGKPLKKYIAHAVFPKFKNLEPGTRVDFDFPLTALVGPNGIGKTSILHAMWGMPLGYSTNKFWFSTDLDPIEGSRKNPQRYFYGHWHEKYNGIVETRKARLGKKRDYWEPYRLSIRDGMQPLPKENYPGKSKDRWTPVKRNVVYINSRAVFGSFDRYFYFDKNIDSHRDDMLREAKRLKKIKETKRNSYILGKRERLFENRELSPEETDAVSKILGRNYEGAHILRHSLYPKNRGRDLSVIFKRGNEYSEAFAGSGEISAVSIVIDILSAEEYSLILLDEPETSLHPGAQRALLQFLLEQIKLKKHQIIISTHSHEFLKGLPYEAIKVFEDNGDSKTRVIPSSSPAAALNRLGSLNTEKVRILVEDVLAESIVKHAIKFLDKGDQETIEVKVAPGGADAILKYLGTAAMTSGDDVYVMLDGDKRKADSFTNPESIPPSDYKSLGQILKSETGLDPLFHIPGGDGDAAHEKAKVEAQLNYLSWLGEHLDYLPKPIPETIIINALAPKIDTTAMSNKDQKDLLVKITAEEHGIPDPSELASALQMISIAKIPQDNQDLVNIRATISNWLANSEKKKHTNRNG